MARAVPEAAPAALLDVEDVGTVLHKPGFTTGALRLALCRCEKREEAVLCDEGSPECRHTKSVVFVPAGTVSAQQRPGRWSRRAVRRSGSMESLQRREASRVEPAKNQRRRAEQLPEVAGIPGNGDSTSSRPKSSPCALCTEMQNELGLSAESFEVSLGVQLDKRRKIQNARTRFTAEHVAMHCTRRSLWVTCDGGVFDITTYLREHPGGPDSLLKSAGDDVSSHVAFHSSEMKRLLTNHLQVGTLDSANIRENWCTII